ncbi:methyl-accepting chemotaxis protein [Paracoccus jiaweipingae]|uniref:methyl-accepting chemotaxis protein n=1 Tax=Paracoccus sp. p2-l61 TaxID=3366950 RepID=UPI0037A26878
MKHTKTISSALGSLRMTAIIAIAVTALTCLAFIAVDRFYAQKVSNINEVRFDVELIAENYKNVRNAELMLVAEKKEQDVESYLAAASQLEDVINLAAGATRKAGLENAREKTAELATNAVQRNAIFLKLIQVYRKLGFTPDTGLEGELRSAVHALEDTTKKTSALPLQVDVLMLRRHEKDFMLRGNQRYIADIDARVKKIKASPADVFGGLAAKTGFLKMLDSYHTAFGAYAQKATMGVAMLDNSKDLLQQAYPVLDQLQAETSAAAAATARQAFQIKLAMAAAALALLVLSFGIFLKRSAAMSRGISEPLSEVTRSISALAAGQDSVPVSPGLLSEINDIAEALETFRASFAERERLKSEAERTREAHSAERQRNAEEERQRIEKTQALERAAASEIAEVVQTCAAGDFSRRLRTDDKSETFSQIADGVNQISDAAERGLTDAIGVLQALAAGRLTTRMSLEHSGIFREMAQAVNETIDNLRAMIERVVVAGNHIDLASDEVARAGQKTAERSERTAETLQNSAAALEELTASVASTAENANNARVLANDAKTRAEQNRQIGSQTGDAINRIASSSEKIARITGMIEDISFQTNLLALNAGVEAARAGEAGAGFAVIASEVRDLAQKSSQAARDISQLISTSTEQVRDGVELVSRSSEALVSMQESINTIVGRVAEIAEANSEQSTAIMEINHSINALDQMTQENMLLIEETTSADNALRSEAVELASVVARFDMGELDHSAPQADDRHAAA